MLAKIIALGCTVTIDPVHDGARVVACRIHILDERADTDTVFRCALADLDAQLESWLAEAR